MSNRLGADVRAMRDTAARMRREASNIRGYIRTLDSGISHTWWEGQDADRFRQEWQGGRKRELSGIADKIEAAARAIQEQAVAQERCSGD